MADPQPMPTVENSTSPTADPMSPTTMILKALGGKPPTSENVSRVLAANQRDPAAFANIGSEELPESIPGLISDMPSIDKAVGGSRGTPLPPVPPTGGVTPPVTSSYQDTGVTGGLVPAAGGASAASGGGGDGSYPSIGELVLGALGIGGGAGVGMNLPRLFGNKPVAAPGATSAAPSGPALPPTEMELEMQKAMQPRGMASPANMPPQGEVGPGVIPPKGVPKMPPSPNTPTGVRTTPSQAAQAARAKVPVKVPFIRP